MNDDKFLNDRDCTPKGETPRTEALLKQSSGVMQTVQGLTNLARELERELTRALRVVDTAVAFVHVGGERNTVYDMRNAVEEWEAGR